MDFLNSIVEISRGPQSHATSPRKEPADDDTLTTVHDSTYDGSFTIASISSPIASRFGIAVTPPSVSAQTALATSFASTEVSPIASWTQSDLDTSFEEPEDGDSKLEQGFYEERLATTQTLLETFTVENRQQQQRMQDMSSCLTALQENYHEVSAQHEMARRRADELERTSAQLKRQNQTLESKQVQVLKQRQEQHERLVNAQRRLEVMEKAWKEEQATRSLEQDMQLDRNKQLQTHLQEKVTENTELRRQLQRRKQEEREGAASAQSSISQSPPLVSVADWRLKAELEDTRKEVQTLEEELSALRTKSGQTQESLQSRLDEYQERVMLARKEMRSAKTWMDSLLDELEACKQANRSNQQHLHRAKAQSAVLREQYDKCLTEQYDGADTEQHHRRAKELLKELEEERVKSRLAKQELSRSVQNRNALQEKVSEACDEVESLRFQVQSRDEESARRESKHNREISHLRSLNASSQMKLEGLRNQMKAREQEQETANRELQSRLDHESERYSLLAIKHEQGRQEMVLLKKERSEILSNYQEALASKKELEGQVEGLLGRLKEAQAQETANGQAQQELEGQNRRLSLRLQELESGQAKLTNKLRQSERAKKEAQRSLESLRSKLRQVEVSNRNLDSERYGMRSDLHDMQDTMDCLILRS